MEKLHLSDDQMRTFLGDYGSGRPGEKVGVAGTTNTHVLGKGRPGEKVGVERTTRTEYVLEGNILSYVLVVLSSIDGFISVPIGLSAVRQISEIFCVIRSTSAGTCHCSPKKYYPNCY